MVVVLVNYKIIQKNLVQIVKQQPFLKTKYKTNTLENVFKWRHKT